MRLSPLTATISFCISIVINLCFTPPLAQAQIVSQQRYRNQQMEQLKGGVSWKVVGVPLDYQKSSTVCADTGKQTFNSVTRRMQLCDGGKQYNLNCGVSPNSCTVPQNGLQNYDEAAGVMRYCNGLVWMYMASVPNIPCCPEGFIPVPFNTAAGTNRDFCVAKYHMKPVRKADNIPINGKNLGMDNNYYPESRAADQPWGGINLAFAKAACAGLGPEFHLMTNAEWMTVAKSIETNPLNWSGNAVGNGHIPTGHSDGYCQSPGAPVGCNTGQDYLAASPDDNSGCFGTGNNNCLTKTDNDFWQKRTLVLSNGEVIWDMAGNMNSWVDAGATIVSPLATPAPQNIYQLNDTVGNNPLYPGPTKAYPLMTPFLFPLNPQSSTNKFAFLPANDYGTAAYDQLGFGIIRLDENFAAGLYRGGKFDEPRLWHSGPDPDIVMRHWQINEYERRGGLYSVWVFPVGAASNDISFRCSYIPNN
jgi:hypothetical protein